MPNETLVPILLGLLIAVLGWMASNIHDIAKSLAQVVSKVDDHGRRLERLEEAALDS